MIEIYQPYLKNDQKLDKEDQVLKKLEIKEQH